VRFIAQAHSAVLFAVAVTVAVAVRFIAQAHPAEVFAVAEAVAEAVAVAVLYAVISATKLPTTRHRSNDSTHEHSC
jgi:hypothetical protein